jgi:tetratricopeptide (TPR) repeat protein
MRVAGIWFVAVMLLASLLIGCSHNLLNRGQQYELAGNNASALLTYQEALAKTSERDGRARAQILMRIGECLYRMDRLPESFNSFRKAADLDPTNTLAHLRLGELLLMAGSPEGAREQAMLVLATMPRDEGALSLLGSALVASDNPTMAKAVYEQVLQSDPKQVKIAVALADLYNRENKTEKAREILQHAAQAQPGSALPWLATARLEEQEGNGPQAEAAYRRAVSVENTPETNYRLAQFLQRAARITEAEQALRRVDAQRSQYPVALPDFQLLSGHPGEAMEQYRVALQASALTPPRRHFWQREVFSSQPSSSKNQATLAARLIEAEISAATQHVGKQRTNSLAEIRKRLDDFHSVLDQATISILHAELALADNNLALAQIFAKSATDLAPESSAAHYVSGLVESSLGNPETAAREWQASLDNDSHYMPAQLALAEAALENDKGDEADEYARAVVRDDPGNFHALIVFARALLLEGKPSLAAIMAHRAAALDPSSPEPPVLMGEIAYKLNRIPEALLAFERAVAAHPDSEEAIDGLLRVYRRGTVSYSALEKMESIAEAPPTSGTLLEITGRLYAERGWYSEAIRALNKAIQADPSRTTAARVLARLQLATGDYAQASKVASKVTPHESLLSAYHADSGGNWRQAIAGYERAVREGDQTGVAANNLAWLYAEHNAHLDRALSLAESAVKISSDDPSILDTLGYVYMQRREYTLAVKVFETAVRLSEMKNSPAAQEAASRIRKHLSDAYFRSGQNTAAAQIAQNRRPITLK